jgi:hypothetical protein
MQRSRFKFSRATLAGAILIAATATAVTAGIASAEGRNWSPAGQKPGPFDLPARDQQIEIKDSKGAVAYAVPMSRAQPIDVPSDPSSVLRVKPGATFAQIVEIPDAEGIVQVRVTSTVSRTPLGGVATTQNETVDVDKEVAACRASSWSRKGCISAERLRANPNDRDLSEPFVIVDGSQEKG